MVNKDGTVVSSETITINKGKETNVNGNTITVSENQSTIHLTTSSSGSTLSTTATFNPYASNTLAYNIINNAKTNKNGTIYTDVPLTTPAVSSSGQKYVKADDPTSFTSSRSSATSYYITYSDDYTINEKDGKFTLINKDGSTPITAKYTGTAMAETLKGKYAYWSTNENTAKNVTNIWSIYKITTTEGDIAASTIKYEYIYGKQVSTESVLSVTTDDYGTSYYYRGGVTDNYVNFAGMCWRIVRIEGDGSVKLILEDRNEQCNDKEGQDLNNNGTYFTGNWSGSEEDYYEFGYISNYRADFINYEGGLADSFKTFQTTLAKKIDSSIGDTPTNEQVNNTLANKLKVDEWCYDDKVSSASSYGCEKYNPNTDEFEMGVCTDEYYGASTRIEINKKPSLNCSGTKLTKFRDNTNMYVGTLTADEIVFAGATSTTLAK